MENGKPEVLGDTTEGALLVSAQRATLSLSEINSQFERVYEVPFTSDRKRMSVIVKEKETDEYFLISKGAPETLIEYCDMTKSEKEAVRKALLTEARNGYRTLGFGRRKLSKQEVKSALDHDQIKEDSLTYLGLVSMQDPLRKEVAETIQKAKNAGIRTIMITGDHKETAGAIARLAGIAEENHLVLTDMEVNHLSVPEIRDRIDHGVSVFARISPLNKLKIIQAIKHSPHTQVAVTGDGVNDAPALKAAHIGIAMGKSGTDLTREVADIIITDDNYVTIIEAIREGRVIFSNLVKFIRYLISCNISEVFFVAVATFLNIAHPLFPIQLLWINFITDGFPALALGMEPPESDVMKRPPRDLREGILHKKRWAYMILEGIIMGAIVFGLFYWALGEFGEQTARTMGFSALAVVQIVHAFNVQSIHRSIIRTLPFNLKHASSTLHPNPSYLDSWGPRSTINLPSPRKKTGKMILTSLSSHPARHIRGVSLFLVQHFLSSS
jgi:Ca2+-transporting ATPase